MTNTMKDFLEKNFSSIMPQWLADYRQGEEEIEM